MSHDDNFNFDPAFDDEPEEIVEDDPDTLHDRMKEDLQYESAPLPSTNALGETL